MIMKTNQRSNKNTPNQIKTNTKAEKSNQNLKNMKQFRGRKQNILVKSKTRKAGFLHYILVSSWWVLMRHIVVSCHDLRAWNAMRFGGQQLLTQLLGEIKVPVAVKRCISHKSLHTLSASQHCPCWTLSSVCTRLLTAMDCLLTLKYYIMNLYRDFSYKEMNSYGTLSLLVSGMCI